jgi:hypothetical protein
MAARNGHSYSMSGLAMSLPLRAWLLNEQLNQQLNVHQRLFCLHTFVMRNGAP